MQRKIPTQAAARFIVQPYQDLILEFFPGNELKKAILQFKIFQYYKKTDTEKKPYESILRKCGCKILDDKRALTDGRYESLVYTINGNKRIGEALTAFLDYTDSHQVNEAVVVWLKDRLRYIHEQICLDHERKNKNFSVAVKNNANYSVLEKVQNECAIRNANKVKSFSRKRGEEKISFSIFRYGDINDITSFSSELFALLLGSEQVGKTRTGINEYGIRCRTVSTELKGFVSLHDLIEHYPDQNEFIKTILIPLGLGKIEVANHVFAENDGHWKNTGIRKNKKNQWIMARIDFDQTLWPIVSIYHGISREVADKKFQVEQYDIDELPDLCTAKPNRGLKLQILYNKPWNQVFLRQVETDPDFVADKWYAYLKYLLINDNMYKARVDYFIPSKKLHPEILDFLRLRREAFRTLLLENISFINYLLKNQGWITCIINEFDKENDRYQNNETQKSLLINTHEIRDIYYDLLNEAIIIKSESEVYPESYNKFWMTNRTCAGNIIAILKDYNDPEYGWFLTGHWTRSHGGRVVDIINQLSNLLDPQVIKNILLQEIAAVANKPDANLDGSYMKRLEFCCAKIAGICQDLELELEFKPVSVTHSI